MFYFPQSYRLCHLHLNYRRHEGCYETEAGFHGTCDPVFFPDFAIIKGVTFRCFNFIPGTRNALCGRCITSYSLDNRSLYKASPPVRELKWVNPIAHVPLSSFCTWIAFLFATGTYRGVWVGYNSGG